MGSPAWRLPAGAQYYYDELTQDSPDKLNCPLPKEGTFPESDVSLIEHCLSLTPEGRLEAHEAARQLMTELSEAGRKYYEGQS